MTALAVTAAGALLLSAPASAAAVTISDASFTWGVSNTANAGAYAGGCNFLSAGTAGSTGSSTVWTASSPSPGYSTQSGNVIVEKPGSGGSYSQPTFATKCQDATGTAVTPSTNTASRVRFTNGTGTLDVAANTASISWTGSFTSAFYGGMIYWSATNPTLTVNANGTGTLTATLSGYGASMTDPGEWTTLTPTTATLATLSGVTVTSTGFTVTPSYLGTNVTVPSGASPQSTSGASWGAFPQSFVDFQGLTGESSYWYSSGSGDSDKVALPISFAYTTSSAAQFDPTLSVTPSSNIADGATITVNGTGYDTTTPNAHGTGNAGAYVELGWINAAAWKPSTGAPTSSRAYTAAVWVHSSATSTTSSEAPLNPDGTFTATLTVSRSALLAKQFSGATLAVFTVAAGGATSAGSEAYAPISLAPAPGEQTITTTVVEAPGEFTWTIDSASHAVTLSNAQNVGGYLESTGSLLPVVVTDTRAGSPAWSVSGQVGDFTGGLSGKYLGWTPKVTAAGAGAVAGSSVSPGITAGNGLTDASTLAAASTGHAKGSTTLGADLDLRLPVDTAPGTYTATLTLTALS